MSFIIIIIMYKNKTIIRYTQEICNKKRGKTIKMQAKMRQSVKNLTESYAMSRQNNILNCHYIKKRMHPQWAHPHHHIWFIMKSLPCSRYHRLYFRLCSLINSKSLK